jgi:hypothetical protein
MNDTEQVQRRKFSPKNPKIKGESIVAPLLERPFVKLRQAVRLLENAQPLVAGLAGLFSKTNGSWKAR